jgi:hypothetical protein
MHFYGRQAMGFKENLLQKMHIDHLARKVIASIGPPGSGRRIDKEAMVRLLETGAFEKIRKRDLELYVLEGDAADGKILVLDNDLAVYHTSADDVALRKSPYIKEMVRIRNIKKILNDADVVESKKEASVRTVQNYCIEALDLRYAAADIEALAGEGAAALEAGDAAAVREALDLFAELLGYQAAPEPFRLNGVEMMGLLADGKDGQTWFGPGVVHDPAAVALKWIDVPVGSFDKETIRHLHQVAKGQEDAPAEGPAVFQMLKGAVFSGRD